MTKHVEKRRPGRPKGRKFPKGFMLNLTLEQHAALVARARCLGVSACDVTRAALEAAGVGKAQ